MCGRFSFVASKEKVKKQFGVVLPDEEPIDSYNIAPTQEAYALTTTDMRAERLRWGLIPHWANAASVGNNLINARAEDIQTRPSFRLPIRHQRCVVFADSFYEWRTIGKSKQPYRIHLPGNELIAFAAIWDEWKDEKGKPLKTFAIITTAPNEEMLALHNRMPALLIGNAAIQQWLGLLPLASILSMLQPAPDGTLTFYPVSEQVNSVQHNIPALHRPIELPPTLF